MFVRTFVQTALLFVSLPLLACGRNIPVLDQSTSISTRDVFPRTTIATSGVTVNGSPNTANTYPRATRLSDNSIVLGYTHHDGAARTIYVVRSTDNGATFNPYGTVASRPSNADMDNVFLLEVPGSTPPRVLAAFRNHDLNANGAYTQFRITVCQSVDGGKGWAFLSQAAEHTVGAKESPALGLWEPFMRIGNNGNVQLTFSQELSASNQETFRVVSANGGLTWGSSADLVIHPTSQGLRDGMNGVAAVTDSGSKKAALVMVFETNPNTDFNIEYAVSYDDGATWGNRAALYVPPTGKNAGAPQITLVGSRLVVVFMTDETTATQDWPNVADVKTVTAPAGLKNGKIVWDTTAQLVSSSPSHWPGVMTIGDKAFSVFDHDSVISGTMISFS